MARHIQNILHNLAGKVLGPEWRVLRLLLEHWPAIVGEAFARHACPVGVSVIPRNGKTAGKTDNGQDEAKLFVRIPGALAPQFQMMESVMRARINTLIGYDFITRIIFEHKVGE